MVISGKLYKLYFNYILFYRWEEGPRNDGVKWNTLEHMGPVFAPAYDRLPRNVRFYYAGQEMKLSEGAEEVAGFYARMLDHDYTTKDIFNKNFFKDWRKVSDCDTKKSILVWFLVLCAGAVVYI